MLDTQTTQPATFPPIERAPGYDVDVSDGASGRRWAVAREKEGRRLTAGQLAAARIAIKRTIRRMDREGITADARRENLAGALTALDDCHFGTFYAEQAVEVISPDTWERTHRDFKGGDPAQGTARYMPPVEDRGEMGLVRVLVER